MEFLRHGGPTRRLRVFAPAGVGNFAAGFDVLGAAVAPEDGSPWGDLVVVGVGGGVEEREAVEIVELIGGGGRERQEVECADRGEYPDGRGSQRLP